MRLNSDLFICVSLEQTCSTQQPHATLWYTVRGYLEQAELTGRIVACPKNVAVSFNVQTFSDTLKTLTDRGPDQGSKVLSVRRDQNTRTGIPNNLVCRALVASVAESMG